MRALRAVHLTVVVVAAVVLVAASHGVWVSAQRTREIPKRDKSSDPTGTAAEGSEKATVSYYALLGIDQTADEKEIRRAYRRAALTSHPDKLPPGTSDEERERSRAAFVRMANAHDILSDPETRKRYDWLLTRGVLEYDERMDWSGFEGGKASRHWRPRTYEERKAEYEKMESDEMWAFVLSMAGAAIVASLPLLYAARAKWRKAKQIEAAKEDLRNEQKAVGERLRLIAELKAEDDAERKAEAEERRNQRIAKERAEAEAAAAAGGGDGDGGGSGGGGGSGNAKAKSGGGGGGGASNPLKCELCGNKYKSIGQLETHFQSAAHKKAAKEADKLKAREHKREGKANAKVNATANANGKNVPEAPSDGEGDGDGGDGAGEAAGDAAADADADRDRRSKRAAKEAAKKTKKKAALSSLTAEVASEAGSASAAADAEPDEEMRQLNERLKAKAKLQKLKAAAAAGTGAAAADSQA